jgi:radial spoke head protein 1
MGYAITQKRNGRGIYTYAEKGDIYDGEFMDNMKHGIGKMTYKEKGEYHGYWENGKKHREGVFKYLNKDIYSGSWKHGKKDGKGAYIFNDTGMKFIGEWKTGKFVMGKWIFPNGTYYEGAFENNLPKGVGKWYFKNGNSAEGLYEQKANADEATTEEGKGPSIQVSWSTKTDISSKALLVNSIER